MGPTFSTDISATVRRSYRHNPCVHCIRHCHSRRRHTRSEMRILDISSLCNWSRFHPIHPHSFARHRNDLMHQCNRHCHIAMNTLHMFWLLIGVYIGDRQLLQMMKKVKKLLWLLKNQSFLKLNTLINARFHTTNTNNQTDHKRTPNFHLFLIKYCLRFRTTDSVQSISTPRTKSVILNLTSPC